MAPLLFDSKSTIIAEDLRGKIKDGIFSATDKLPPTRELALNYAVSRETINIAMSELVNEGLIKRKRGFGSVVAKTYPEQSFKPHLGIFLPMLKDKQSSLSPNESPVWSLIFYGVLHACAIRGYTLIPIPDTGASWEKIVSDHHLGGILLPGGNIKIIESFWASGVQNRVKYLMIDRAMNFTTANYIEEFSPMKICKVIKLLQAKGHRRIAAVGTDDDQMVFQNFFAGYRMAMTASNDYSPSYVKRLVKHQPEEYDQLVHELMARKEPPTLIMIFNYCYVAGVIDALERYGVKVPNDISIVMTNYKNVAYRDQQITAFTSLDKQLFGDIAANSLMDLIEHKAKVPLQLELELKFNQGDTFRDLNA
jgi:DNA-binding LacI/PurR family transcriptional regulator